MLLKIPKFCLSICALLLFLCDQSESANILGLFPLPSKSDHILASKLMRTLAERGHRVTMVSPYPSKKFYTNYTHICLEEIKENMLPIMNKKNEDLSWFQWIKTAIRNPSEITELVLKDSRLRRNLESQPFDLVIQTALFSDPLLGIAHQLNASVIYFSSIGATPHMNTFTGNPMPLSYVPVKSLFVPDTTTSTTELTLLQRLGNVWSYFFYEVCGARFKYNGDVDMLNSYFPEAPALSDLLNNISLVLLNTHYSMESPRPYVPNMVQIGGFHVEPPKNLDGDLKQFLDEAKSGAILLSFGSSVKFSHIKTAGFWAILKTLGGLRQRVVLKSEVDIPHLPTNMKLVKWIVANDILAHPNVVLFVSNGGPLSTIEAVYHAVPVLGIPFTGDQEMNVATAVSQGYAMTLNVKELTEETFRAAIDHMLKDPKYQDTIELKSWLLRNQAVRPLELAVFWVNHVLEHKGAQHLQNDGVRLNLLQYLLIDVFLFLNVLVLIFIGIVYIVWQLRANGEVFGYKWRKEANVKKNRRGRKQK